jgi:hypothetical protein
MKMDKKFNKDIFFESCEKAGLKVSKNPRSKIPQKLRIYNEKGEKFKIDDSSDILGVAKIDEFCESFVSTHLSLVGSPKIGYKKPPAKVYTKQVKRSPILAKRAYKKKKHLTFFNEHVKQHSEE